MDEIKIGMYVRTKNGIGKIDETEMFMDKYFQFHLDSNKGSIHNVTYNKYWNEIEDIIGEPSKSPFDLIQDDDIAVIEYYVSKYRQRIRRRFECSLFDHYVIFENKHCEWWYDKLNKEWRQAKGFNPKLKYIVTNDQFESMKCEIGGKNERNG